LTLDAIHGQLSNRSSSLLLDIVYIYLYIGPPGALSPDSISWLPFATVFSATFLLLKIVILLAKWGGGEVEIEIGRSWLEL